MLRDSATGPADVGRCTVVNILAIATPAVREFGRYALLGHRNLGHCACCQLGGRYKPGSEREYNFTDAFDGCGR